MADRVVAIFYLPLDMTLMGKILEAFGKTYPSARLENEGNDTVVKIVVNEEPSGG